MELDALKAYLDTSPALKLLKSPNAAYIIDFLYRTFKRSNRITVRTSDLQSSLDDYREGLHETYPDALADKAENYLATWCSGETRWLHRFLEGGRNEPQFQLTPHAEDVFVFLDRALQRDLGFVGTESRLKLVISMLADLVAEASSDADVRLKHLMEQRARIDAEIASVARDGVTTRLEPAAVRERFSTAVSLLKQLLADFRAVEERFKEITQQVQRRQADGRDTRGTILGFALDSEEVLKEEDQGVSFYEFVRFILSPIQQERLRALIEQLGRIEDIASQADGLLTVRRMVPSLLAEAEKVMRTNQRLSATLRRLLDSRAASERRRLAQLLDQIGGLAARLADAAPLDGTFAEPDGGVGLGSGLERAFWAHPSRFTKVDLIERVADEAERLKTFRLLARMQRLDFRAMRARVARLTAATPGTVTLRQVVEAEPPVAGVVELLGYLQIAKDDRHVVSRTASEEIVLRLPGRGGRVRRVTVPLVFFLPAHGTERGSNGQQQPSAARDV
ncbi:MAG TPA: DUF3375 family protein [Candidatus Polarisedimenticolia bacterium]|nr:DUF3375 family protein [Candidatus Polarisedimenticolia bacterium]